MKIDLEKQQASFRTISESLKGVKAPLKDAAEWITLENELFSRLNVPVKPRRYKSPSFVSYFFKPYFRGAVSALLVLVVGFSFFYRFGNTPVDPFTGVMSIHGTVIASSPDMKTPDTLRDIRDFKKVRNNGKNCVFKTLANSSFIMRLDRGSAFELAQNSLVAITEISRKSMLFNLDRGSILVKVSKRLKNQKFIVATPSASCVVVGTIFKVEAFDAKGKQTALSVYEGKVKFQTASGNARRTIFVASGQTCREENGVFGDVRSISETETPIKNISLLQLLLDRQESSITQYGIVDVSVKPQQALILIDDSLAGRSPLLVRKPVGRHSVTIAANGFISFEKTIAVGSDSISAIIADLQRTLEGKPAARAVSSKPARQCAVVVFKPESTLVAVPEYVEAMVQLTIGEYQKAIGILDSLKNTQPIDMKSRMSIMRKINESYLKLGNFSKALEKLEDRFEKATDSSSREQTLWEMANIKANCLGDYPGAEMALVELLMVNPSGKQAKDALFKLAETQYMLNKFDCAAATYRNFLKDFQRDPDFDKALFSLADIVDNDAHGYQEALLLYGKLLTEHPQSPYADAARFARAQCLIKLGRTGEARMGFKKYLSLSPQGMWSSACAEKLKELK
jgi:tetratricopeptide (TPR) repeat protein